MTAGVAEIAPKLLGHWRNKATGEWTMELEYVPRMPHYELQGLQNVKLYMSGLLQVPEDQCPLYMPCALCLPPKS